MLILFTLNHVIASAVNSMFSVNWTINSHIKGQLPTMLYSY